MNLQTLKRMAIAATCCVLSSQCWMAVVQADISMPKIFSDHMVLQRNSRVRIWGTSDDAGQQLTVKFAGKESTVTTSDNGSWSVNINTPDAGGPYELEVIAAGGQPKVVFNDVLVGEVWLCVGQNNMQLEVSKTLNSENEIKLSKNFPRIRLFTVGDKASPQPLSDFHKVVPWRVCSPETVKDFSATAYFFGREISKKLKGKDLASVPIGLIDVSWDGTVCEAWTSRAALDKVEQLAPLLKHWDENPELLASPNRPGNLFNGMIAPMLRFPIRGVIWYQGEANHERGAQYSVLFPTVIKDWRKNFGLGEFPFYFVQLAPYRYVQKPAASLAEIRDAQLKTLHTVRGTRMVVTTDIGDLQDLNPKNKQEVGRRLALAALADVYADQLPADTQKPFYSGPIYDTKSIDQDRIRISFRHTHGGLAIRNDEPELTCFTICGEDGKFVPAEAKIEGDRLIVSSPDVKNPVEVRFAWNDSDQPNLVNAQGLPASPFRTDDFPLISEGRDF